MIFLKGKKWNGSVKRLFEEHNKNHEFPEFEKEYVRKMIKAYGVVYCDYDPFEEEINGRQILIFAATENGLEQLLDQASQEI